MITTPIRIICQKADTLLMLSPLRNRPMMTTPESTPSTVPRPPKNEAPPMITAAMASSSMPMPALGKPELVRPASSKPGEAGEEAADDVDIDEHAIDIDAGDARGLRIAADRIDVPAERGAGHEEPQADRADDDEERGSPEARPAA